jgi:hypothetical protein
MQMLNTLHSLSRPHTLKRRRTWPVSLTTTFVDLMRIAVVLGFDIEYGVQPKRAALSVWRPRTVKDEEGKQALILESVRDREANVRQITSF